MKLDGLQKLLDREINFKNIEDLPVPMYIGVTNMTDGFTEFRNKGPLSKTIMASSSIPVLFSPVEINDKLYCDGGLLENIPVEPLLGNCNRIVVSNISPLQKPAEIKNLVQMVIRTFHLSIHSRIKQAKNHADLYIEPEQLTHFDLLSVGQADDAFEIGYKAVAGMDEKLFEVFKMAAKQTG